MVSWTWFAARLGNQRAAERSGGRVALITTAGFEDVLEIGRQARPKLYDFFVEKPEALVPARARIGAHERLAWDGEVIEPLSDREVRRLLVAVRRERPTPSQFVSCFAFAIRDMSRWWRQLYGARVTCFGIA